VVEENGVISIVENILLPAAVLEGTGEFQVERRDAEPLVYTSIAQLKEDYTQDIVCISSIGIYSIRINRHIS
jgi:tyrosyl-tRNA synthetase